MKKKLDSKYKAYTHRLLEKQGTDKQSPTQCEIKDFVSRYGQPENSGILPVIVSVFAQESKTPSSGFIRALDSSIPQIKSEVRKSSKLSKEVQTPIYYMFLWNEESTQNEKLLINHLIAKKYNVILVGDKTAAALPAGARFIQAEHPLDFILDCCLMMVAFWDGLPNSVNGAHVEKAVVNMLKGKRDNKNNTGENYKIRFPHSGAIFHHIIDNENLINNEKCKPFTLRILYTHYAETGNEWFYVTAKNTKENDFIEGGKKAKEKRSEFQKQNKQLISMNKSLKKHRFTTSTKGNADDLLPSYIFQGNEGRRINEARKRFAFYDTFAIKNQKCRKRQSIFLISITALALVLFDVFADLYDNWIFLLAYILLFFTAIISFLVIDCCRAHENYILGRVLAESMRAQTYWYSIGIDKSVRADYPIAHREELGWLNLSINALHAVSMSMGGEIGNSADGEMLEHIKCLWIGKEDYDNASRKLSIYNVGQYQYFDNSEFNKTKKSKKSGLRENILYAFLAVIALLLGIVICIPHFSSLLSFSEHIASWFETISLFIIGLAPVAIAAIALTASINAFKEEAVRHGWSKKLTKRALTDFDSCENTATKTKIFEEFGTQVVDENGDWALMKLERHPEIIKD